MPVHLKRKKRAAMSLTGVYCTRCDRLVCTTRSRLVCTTRSRLMCTTHSRLHVYQA